MKIFCKEQIQALEQLAVREGTSMERLMERAGLAVAAEAAKFGVAGKRAVVLCGKGNNGGDGFVCARALARQGAEVTVVLADDPPATELAGQAFLRMPETVTALCAEHEPERAEAALNRADLIVDAVFGFGFRGAARGTAAKLLELANARNCRKISADLPSGAECDTAEVHGPCFRADVTVTFTGLKPVNVCYPGKEFCGETVLAEVGIPPAAVESMEAGLLLTDDDFVRERLPRPGVQSNKGDLGKLLCVCGSYGMAGACILAARAALRCGAGLVRVAAEQSVYPILAQAMPEAVFTVLNWEGDEAGSRKALLSALETSTACLMGCGLGMRSELVCPEVLSHCRIPLLLDADGLNFLARHPDARQAFHGPLVMTPHPGEMARLAGVSIPEVQAGRLETAREQARRWDAVAVLKGAATVISAPDGRTAINPTGNPGMATGGSGDVLAGMTASFLAQGMEPFEAAALGAYLHGLAGDWCARKRSMRGMLPTDLVETLPELFLELEETGPSE